METKQQVYHLGSVHIIPCQEIRRRLQQGIMPHHLSKVKQGITVSSMSAKVSGLQNSREPIQPSSGLQVTHPQVLKGYYSQFTISLFP